MTRARWMLAIVAGICIPLRGIPPVWFWVDAAFAPLAAIPLAVALRDIHRAEKEDTPSTTLS